MSAAEEVSDQAPEAIPDEDVLEELIFKQDLNEVHLLIDFVSGRADRSLGTLSMRDPGDPAKTMTSGEIIKAIAEMRYPPKGTDAVNARNAAILLVAKDQLSALATPATGLTIAYTRLFIGEEAGVPWSGLRRRAGLGQNRERDHDIRIDLAQRSFPSLQAHASKFRIWRDWLALLSLFWLALTALAYWDAGLGRTALERLDLDWKLVVEELNNNPALIRCEVGRTESPERHEDLQSDDNALRGEFACRKYNYLRVVAQTAGQEVNAVFHCGNMRFARLPHVWCWNWLLSGSAVNRDAYDNNSESAPGNARQVQAPAPALATAETAGQALGQAPSGIGIQVLQYARANVAYWQTATDDIIGLYCLYSADNVCAARYADRRIPRDPQSHRGQRTVATRSGTDADRYPDRIGRRHCCRAVPRPVLSSGARGRRPFRPADPDCQRLGLPRWICEPEFLWLSR